MSRSGPQIGICIEAGCDANRFCKDRCPRHYRNLKLRSAPACSVDGCEKPQESRGWCQAHYCRWKTHGNTETIGKQWKLTLQERFEQYVHKTPTCWLWTGNMFRLGYGAFGVEGKTRSAHTVSYQLHKGTIPTGLEIDHLCNVRNCVNPEHLEAVTHQENITRAHRRRRNEQITAAS